MLPGAMKKLVNFGTAIVGIAILTELVLPRNNTAKIIQEMGQAQSRMIKVMIGERIIENRDVPRFTELLGTIDDPTMTELFAGLTDADLDWVESMLGQS